MEKKANLQLLNFGGFIQSVWLPAKRALDYANTRYAEAQENLSLGEPRPPVGIDSWERFGFYGQSAVWEAYFWLHFGIDLGYFPRREAEDLLRQGFPVSPEFIRPFRPLYPVLLKTLMTDVLRGNEFFPSAGYEGFRDAAAIHIPFQAALMMEASYARSPVTQSFTMAMTFISEPSWEKLIGREEWMKDDLSTERFDRALTGELTEAAEPNKENLLAGFFRAIEHMANFRALFDTLRTTQKLEYADVKLLERRVKEICLWRLNFAAGTAKKRFFDLLDSAALAISLERDRQQLVSSSKPNVPAFGQAVHKIINEWTSGIVMGPVNSWQETPNESLVFTRTCALTAAASGGMKIGLLCGREYSFPPAFIDRVNDLGRAEGITAEFVHLGGTPISEPARYRVIVDRISHEVAYYRGYLKHAVLQGTYVINNPFWWSADDKFFNTSLAQKLGVAVPKTVLLPQKSYPQDVDITSESLRNLEYPIEWDALLDYVGRPAILKPFLGGGWKHVYKVHNKEELLAAYDGTGPYCMVLQEFIDFQQYVRCFSFGKSDIMPVPYEPRERRYLVEHEYLTPELGARVVRDAQTLNQALGYEMNTVEFAIRDGIPYAIDFLNPAPDFELDRITPFYFERVVDRMARLVIDRALRGTAVDPWPRWEEMLGLGKATDFVDAPRVRAAGAGAA